MSDRASRSASRGREVFSTGRGGAGNMRPSSKSREPAEHNSGPDDFSITRGREPRPEVNPTGVFSTGRGGAGNLRSPSRDARPPPTDPYENAVIKDHMKLVEEGPLSSGRGGIGNINRSRSREPSHNPLGFINRSRSREPSSNNPISNIIRSRSREPHSNPISNIFRSRSREPQSHTPLVHPPLHSTGRGGAGNIITENGPFAGEDEEEDDLKELQETHLHEGPHSTGRGGNANITSKHEPTVEHHEHLKTDFQSTGRGGTGNIVKETTPS